MEKIAATWSVSLDADCPDCNAAVDLLYYADFWDGRQLDIAEHGTDRSDNQAVVCPNCGHEFTVKCVW